MKKQQQKTKQKKTKQKQQKQEFSVCLLSLI